jgi:hypothetical protein
MCYSFNPQTLSVAALTAWTIYTIVHARQMARLFTGYYTSSGLLSLNIVAQNRKKENQ